ncbi:TULIP family P47-like protein [Streptacidiphilus rugosus]|uniref:TULIP family P47-like protein n=1 Tax=Streptacidiphilus rugosus TaxID=405783 RepID=UPI00055C2C7F|nr:TULIP family P47-like protein [Streptacidiphilus rugosus]
MPVQPKQHFLPHIDEDKVYRIEIEHLKASAERTSPAHRAVQGTSMKAVAAAGAVPYSTNGWDSVYVIPLPDVNRAIADKKTSPTSWSAELPASLFSPAISGTGTFGTWSMATGGSGSIVRMHIPFTAQISSGTNHIAVAGGVAYVEVKLVYIPQPPNPDGTTPNNLKVRATGGSPDDPVVTVSSVTYTSPTPADPALDNVLEQLLAKWFNANLQKFQQVFATVNLGVEEASGDFAWLSPTETDYAYIDNANINHALLGVLCMTEGRSSEEAIQEISAGAIPEGARASFNLSLERFMSKMALPGLPIEFPHAAKGTFVLGNDDTQISATSSFNLDAVSVAGVNYTPNVTSFTMTLSGATMETYLYIHTPISPGIDAYCEITYYNTMTLATKADGSQSLTWVQSKPTDEKTWYTVASWVTITEAIADIVLAVIGAVVGGVVTSVERVVARVLIALLVGGVVSAVAAVLEKVPEWIAGTVPDAIPSINALVDGATKPTKWADSTDFKITEVVLNGGLQLGGNPFGS